MPYTTVRGGTVASIIRRGTSWRAQIVRRGKRVNRTFDTRAQAERWAVEVEAAILAGGDAAPIPPLLSLTAAALFARYAAEVSPSKGGARWEATRLRVLALVPAFTGPVSALDAPALADWRDARLRQVAPSTVNRELNLISAVLTHAMKEWRVPGLTINPVRAIRRPRNPAARVRRVTAAERDAVVRALGWNGAREPASAGQWVAWAFCLALETAMRKGEVLGLIWRHVHLDASVVHLPRTKNGHARTVPLSSAAVALLRLLAVRGMNDRVAPVLSGTADVLFRRARDAAGLHDLHFHDSRREATTRLAELLPNPLDLAMVTGHRDIRLLLSTYYAPDMTALAKKLG